MRLPFRRQITLQTAYEALLSSPIVLMDRRVAIRNGDWLGFRNGSSRISYFRDIVGNAGEQRRVVETLRIMTNLADGSLDTTFVNDKLVHFTAGSTRCQLEEISEEMCKEARQCIREVRKAYIDAKKAPN